MLVAYWLERDKLPPLRAPLVELALQTFGVGKALLPAPLHAEDLDSVLPLLVHGVSFDSSVHSGPGCLSLARNLRRSPSGRNVG
jgi:hypothetical protein